MGKVYTYTCVNGPLADTRIQREPIPTGNDEPMVAILRCPDGRLAIYRERAYPDASPVPAGLYFEGYSPEA